MVVPKGQAPSELPTGIRLQPGLHPATSGSWVQCAKFCFAAFISRIGLSVSIGNPDYIGRGLSERAETRFAFPQAVQAIARLLQHRIEDLG